MTAFSGIRVVELAEKVAGEFCGKLLADFGADVLKVERPKIGSPTRSIDAEPDSDCGPLFAYLHTNKKSVVLDLEDQQGRPQLDQLILSADVLIDDHGLTWMQEMGLGWPKIRRLSPTTIYCVITPFGLDASKDLCSPASLNIFHAGAWGYHTPSYPDLVRPPLKGAGNYLVDFEAGIDAAMCISASLLWRNKSGRGQFIDVSQQEVMLSRADTVLGRVIAGELDADPSRTAFDQAGPRGFYLCRNGAVYLYMTSRSHWLGLRELMGNPRWMSKFDDSWLEFNVTDEAVAFCRSKFSKWVADKDRDDVSAAAQRLNVPLVPVNNAADLYNSPQFAHRKFFQALAHPTLGEASYPTACYQCSASPVSLSSCAPTLGQHSNEVMRSLERDGESTKTRAPIAAAPSHGGRGGPLEGIRILEITKVWAGPYAGKLLAFLGAEVIKIESNDNLDEMRAYGGLDINRAPYFLSLNPEIMSVQMNMKSDEGITQFKKLVRESDVVLNNIRPGAMERLGLGYEDLRQVKKDIIAVSIKMYGNDGPLGYQTGYAPCFAALGGLNSIVGYEDEPPSGMSTRYGDLTVGAATAFATIAALLHRMRTGEGQFVDVSAVECMASMIGDNLLGYSLTGKIPLPDGNRHPAMAPHGCYPCSSGDWLSIAVSTDQQWGQLCKFLGSAELAGDSRFSNLEKRKAHRAALDRELSALTASHCVYELASGLREEGVPAYKSLNVLDVISEERLWQKGFYRTVSDGVKGTRPIVGAPWKMSDAWASIIHGAPDLGEHNAYVYREVMGCSADEYQELIHRRVVN